MNLIVKQCQIGQPGWHIHTDIKIWFIIKKQGDYFVVEKAKPDPLNLLANTNVGSWMNTTIVLSGRSVWASFCFPFWLGLYRAYDPIDRLKLRGAETAEKDQKAGISEDIIISDSFLTEL